MKILPAEMPISSDTNTKGRLNFGYQSIVWGPKIYSFEYLLESLRSAGFKAIEIAQRYDDLFLVGRNTPIKGINELLRILDQFDIELLGLVGGSLEERVTFLESYRDFYLYVENCIGLECQKAMKDGYKLALHPHIFTSIHDLGDAIRILSTHNHEKFKLIFDTAHLYIAGDDPEIAIEHIDLEKIEVIHLKDWSAEFGRFSHRYSRGFTELGTGDINIASFLNKLLKLKFKNWIVIEQDYSRIKPTQSIYNSAKWLHEAGYMDDAPILAKEPNSTYPVSIQSNIKGFTPNLIVKFLEELNNSQNEYIDSCHKIISTAFLNLTGAKLVEIWSYSGSQDVLGLESAVPLPLSEDSFNLSCERSLMGLCKTRKTITRFSLLNDLPDGRYLHNAKLVSEFMISHMVSIPILNPWNFNHINSFVNLYFDCDKTAILDDDLFELSKYVAYSINSVLSDKCTSAMARSNLLAGQVKNVSEYIIKIKDLILDLIPCQGMSLFLVNDLGDRLELEFSTDIMWTEFKGNRQFYRLGEGFTGKVWQKGEPQLLSISKKNKSTRYLSKEIVENDDVSKLLFFPISDSKRNVLGVLRCRNKLQFKGAVVNFTDDDVAILEAVFNAAAPHLRELLGEDRRRRSLGRLTHELKSPIVAIRAASQAMKMTEGYKKIFQRDYPEYIWSWSEMMRRLYGNADILRYTEKILPLEISPTSIKHQIIAPAVQQIRIMIDKHNLKRRKIAYGDFAGIPMLNVDPEQFQQVAFNLLSNAIKYRRNDVLDFRVFIQGYIQNDKIVIKFIDHGVGFEQDMEEIVFEEGIRGRKARKLDAHGQGLGLWIVRRIIVAHGGHVQVTNLKDPTEITIYLPISLRVKRRKSIRSLRNY